MLSLTRLSAPCITYLNTWTRLHILILCRLVSAAPSALGKIEYYVTRVVSQSETSLEKTHQLRQPIRIEYYVTRVVSQSESSITSLESSANQNRPLHHPSRVLRHPRALGYGGGPFSALGSSRLAIAYLNT